MLTDYINPRKLLPALDKIDAETPSHSMDRKTKMRRVFYTVIAISIALLLVEYLKMNSVFRSTIYYLEGLALIPTGPDSLRNSQYYNLFSYMWWTLWQFIAYVLVPYIFIKLVLKEKFADFGWRWGDTHGHTVGYLVLLTPMLIGVVAVSFSHQFSSFYPMYRSADRSWFDLITWEFLYIAQFICVEFFFRGFILQSLRPALGSGAIFVMLVPYMMIHFTKPMFESVVAFAFGIFAAILALQSRSIWGGVIVHVFIALLMDTMALTQRGAMPVSFWP